MSNLATFTVSFRTTKSLKDRSRKVVARNVQEAEARVRRSVPGSYALYAKPVS